MQVGFGLAKAKSQDLLREKPEGCEGGKARETESNSLYKRESLEVDLKVFENSRDGVLRRKHRKGRVMARQHVKGGIPRGRLNPPKKHQRKRLESRHGPLKENSWNAECVLQVA